MNSLFNLIFLKVRRRSFSPFRNRIKDFKNCITLYKSLAYKNLYLFFS